MQRRSFVVGGLAGGALIACGPRLRTAGPGEPALSEHERATVAAIADALFPPGGAPSARDVDALSVIVEPGYGLLPYLPRVVTDLDDWVGVTHGFHTFVELAPAAREVVLEQRMGLRGGAIASWYRPAYEAILALTKLALYGGIASAIGTSYIGFPGPSAGYAPDSAAGAYTSDDLPRPLAAGTASTIEVAGAGNVTSARIDVLAVGAARAALRITAPGGRGCEIALRASRDRARALDDEARRGVRLDDAALPLAGGPAAGAWRLEVIAAAGRAQLARWSLRLRTELDDPR